jgi:phosphoglycolate phosphatase
MVTDSSQRIIRTQGPWSPLLFDMDGTMLDSAEAITGRLRKTLEHFNVDVPSDEELRLTIGPPAGQGLLKFVGPELGDEARTYYRALSDREGFADQALFDGIAETLKALRAEGFPLGVATSRPQATAEALCEHYGIADYFDLIIGGNQHRPDKASVIAENLFQFDKLGFDRNALMIGDRYFDTEGALANEVPTILVRWGYAADHEFETAMTTVADVNGLLKMLIENENA